MMDDSRYKKPQEPLWHWDLVVVARDGIEPPTRGFSVPCFALYISELRGQVSKKCPWFKNPEF